MINLATFLCFSRLIYWNSVWRIFGEISQITMSSKINFGAFFNFVGAIIFLLLPLFQILSCSNLIWKMEVFSIYIFAKNYSLEKCGVSGDQAIVVPLGDIGEIFSTVGPLLLELWGNKYQNAKIYWMMIFISWIPLATMCHLILLSMHCYNIDLERYLSHFIEISSFYCALLPKTSLLKTEGSKTTKSALWKCTKAAKIIELFTRQKNLWNLIQCSFWKNFRSFHLKKSIELQIKDISVVFFDTWEKKLSRSTAYSCRTNVFI